MGGVVSVTSHPSFGEAKHNEIEKDCEYYGRNNENRLWAATTMSVIYTLGVASISGVSVPTLQHFESMARCPSVPSPLIKPVSAPGRALKDTKPTFLGIMCMVSSPIEVLKKTVSF